MSDLFGSVKMVELPPVLERAADSASHSNFFVCGDVFVYLSL